MLGWQEWRFLYLDHKGRITRQAFWFGWVPLLLVAGVIVQPVAWLAILLEWPREVPRAVGTAVWLLLAWPFWCLAVKRRHDRGGSGIDLLGFAILTVAVFVARNFVFGDEWHQQRWSLISSLATSAYFFALLIPLGILPGTSGPNKYGSDPVAKPPAA